MTTTQPQSLRNGGRCRNQLTKNKKNRGKPLMFKCDTHHFGFQAAGYVQVTFTKL